MKLISNIRKVSALGVNCVYNLVFGNPRTIPRRAIAKYLPSSPVILEAGAHVGHDTKAMAKFWPLATIHAIEPIPALFVELKKRTSALSRVKCHQVALSDNPGIVEMHVSSGDSDESSSVLKPTGHLSEYPTVVFSSKCQVIANTIDSWANSEGISKIDFMWLDLQGHELTTLRASPKILSTTQVIHTEVSLKPLYSGGALYDELRDWLCGQGFKVVQEALVGPDGNVLFVRS